MDSTKEPQSVEAKALLEMVHAQASEKPNHTDILVYTLGETGSYADLIPEEWGEDAGTVVDTYNGHDVTKYEPRGYETREGEVVLLDGTVGQDFGKEFDDNIQFPIDPDNYVVMVTYVDYPDGPHVEVVEGNLN